jgi:transcriptional regulator with XRE-family HTH domain
MNRFSIKKLPSDIIKDLSTNLKIIRKQQRLTQVELAKKSGISLGSLKRFEQTGQISLISLLQLAQILHRLEDFEKLLQPNIDLKRIEKLFSN